MSDKDRSGRGNKLSPDITMELFREQESVLCCCWRVGEREQWVYSPGAFLFHSLPTWDALPTCTSHFTIL